MCFRHHALLSIQALVTKHLILGTAGHIDHGERGYHAPNPEHLDILRLMRVKCGLVMALTKRNIRTLDPV